MKSFLKWWLILIAALLLIESAADAAVRTSTTTGVWSSAATWGGSAAPGNGDTAVISDTTVVTVDVNTTVGTSGPNGTAAVTTAGSGKIIIAGGVTFVIRGDFAANRQAAVYTADVVMNAGSIWEWDSSAAASPATTKYTMYPNAVNSGNVHIESNGTIGSRNIIRSNVGGGNGYFSLGGNAGGCGFVASYTDVLRIGDSTNPAWFPEWNPFDPVAPWNVQHCTFTSCGIINGHGFSIPADQDFRHNYNTHGDTQGLYTLSVTAGAAITTGVREVIGDVFDKIVGDNGSTGSVWRDFTITDNYFGQGLATSGSVGNSWVSFVRNLWRYSPATGGQSGGTMTDNYAFLDSYADLSAHFPDAPLYSFDFLRNIIDASYFSTFSLDISDGLVTAAGTYTNNVKNNIVLPAGDEIGGTALVAHRYTDFDTDLNIEHNTVTANPASAIEIVGSQDAAGATVSTLKNNIFWDPIAARSYVMLDGGHGAAALPTPETDFYPPANLLNNVRFNSLIATDPAKPFLTNQGNSYIMKWSVTPGSSDLTVDPQFVDPTRNLATFDTAYLHNVASSTWASHAGVYTFAVGDIISDTSGSYYAGKVINYRCLLAHTKNTANSQPGVGSAWHTYWEFASLNSIRNGLSAQTTITDPDIKAVGVTYIQALYNWVRVGFSPQNPLLFGAATDGTTIGAMPGVFGTRRDAGRSLGSSRAR